MIWIWGGFLVFILLVLALDLGVLNRKAHVVSVKEALTFTVAVLGLAVLFDVFVYFAYENHWLGLGQHVDRVDGVVNDGRLAAVKFFTGYIIEVSLSADNVFVIAMIFEHLRVPPKYQHRVLFWGILGALVMRGTMIGLGAQLVSRYHWILYVFGVFLVYTALKMLWSKTDEAADPDEALVMRLVRRIFPVCNDYRESHFLIREGGRLHVDAACRGPRTGRDDRSHLRRRLHSGDLRDHDRSVHRFHEQRLRDSRPPVAVFRPCRRDREVPVPQGVARSDSRTGRREDAGGGMAQGRGRAELQLLPARNRRVHSGGRCCGVCHRHAARRKVGRTDGVTAVTMVALLVAALVQIGAPVRRTPPTPVPPCAHSSCVRSQRTDAFRIRCSPIRHASRARWRSSRGSPTAPSRRSRSSKSRARCNGTEAGATSSASSDIARNPSASPCRPSECSGRRGRFRCSTGIASRCCSDSQTARARRRAQRRRRGDTTFAVHPFADDRERVYRFSGGDTVATISPGGRDIPIVRIHVEPSNEQLTQQTAVFRGDVELDGQRAQIVRMRGSFVTLGPRRRSRTRLLASQVEAIAYVEIENGEFEQRYWLPTSQRVEAHAAISLLGEQRAVFRVVSRFRQMEVRTQPADSAADRYR